MELPHRLGPDLPEDALVEGLHVAPELAHVTMVPHLPRPPDLREVRADTEAEVTRGTRRGDDAEEPVVVCVIDGVGRLQDLQRGC